MQQMLPFRMKSSLLVTVLLFSGFPCLAQTKADSTAGHRKFLFEFGGAVGIFLPVSLEKEKIGYKNNFSGSNAVTYLQATYKSRYFAKFQFGQTSVAYKAQSLTGGVVSVIDAKANTNNIGINIGYLREFGRWTPYVMAGTGIALVDVPSVNFDGKTGQNVFSTKSHAYNVITAGGGINYKIGKYFVPFLEGQLSAMPSPGKSSLTHLSGVSMLIGIKASLF
jgi:opacity protein-like surface antigen